MNSRSERADAYLRAEFRRTFRRFLWRVAFLVATTGVLLLLVWLLSYAEGPNGR